MATGEKRSFIRVEIEKNEVYSIQIQNLRGEKIPVTVKDISVSGAGLEFTTGFITKGDSAGDSIHIIFTGVSEDEPFLSLPGIIRWKNMLPHDRVMLGIEFLNPTSEVKKKIVAIIDAIV